jgi:hypothetical protein
MRLVGLLWYGYSLAPTRIRAGSSLLPAPHRFVILPNISDQRFSASIVVGTNQPSNGHALLDVNLADSIDRRLVTIIIIIIRYAVHSINTIIRR